MKYILLTHKFIKIQLVTKYNPGLYFPFNQQYSDVNDELTNIKDDLYAKDFYSLTLSQGEGVFIIIVL